MPKPYVLELVVKIEAVEVPPEFYASQVQIDGEAIEMVTRAIREFGAVKLLSVEPLAPEHCSALNEDFGIPVDVGLPHPANVTPNGCWTYPHVVEGNTQPHRSGYDLGSLVAFVFATKLHESRQHPIRE